MLELGSDIYAVTTVAAMQVVRNGLTGWGPKSIPNLWLVEAGFRPWKGN